MTAGLREQPHIQRKLKAIKPHPTDKSGSLIKAA